MPPIILFGNAQVALNAYAHFTHDSPHQVVAFTVDRAYLHEPELAGLPVVPFEEIEQRYPPSEFGMHISISYRDVNRLRAAKFAQAKEKGYTLVNYVSSRAVVLPDLALGENCLIGALTVVGPYVAIGDNVHIAGSGHIGHHTTIGAHCFMAPAVSISGSVTVGSHCFFGIGSVVRDRLTIAPSSVISAGAVILEDTAPNGVYLAHPAELLPIASDRLKVA